jgi:hypothetical protein
MIVGRTRGGSQKGGQWVVPSRRRRAGSLSLLAEETAYPAVCLYGRPADRYGDGQVFKDLDSIQLGDDFVEQRQEASPEWGAMRDSNPGHLPVGEFGHLRGRRKLF